MRFATFCQWNSRKLVARIFRQWKSGCTCSNHFCNICHQDYFVGNGLTKRFPMQQIHSRFPTNVNNILLLCLLFLQFNFLGVGREKIYLNLLANKVSRNWITEIFVVSNGRFCVLLHNIECLINYILHYICLLFVVTGLYIELLSLRKWTGASDNR